MASVFDCDSLDAMGAGSRCHQDRIRRSGFRSAAAGGGAVRQAGGAVDRNVDAWKRSRAAAIVAKELPKGVAAGRPPCGSAVRQPLSDAARANQLSPATGHSRQARCHDRLFRSYARHRVGAGRAGSRCPHPREALALEQELLGLPRSRALGLNRRSSPNWPRRSRRMRRCLARAVRDGDLPDAATRAAARRGIVTSRDRGREEDAGADDLDYVRPAKGISAVRGAREVDRPSGGHCSAQAHHVIPPEDLASGVALASLATMRNFWVSGAGAGGLCPAARIDALPCDHEPSRPAGPHGRRSGNRVEFTIPRCCTAGFRSSISTRAPSADAARSLMDRALQR